MRCSVNVTHLQAMRTRHPSFGLKIRVKWALYSIVNLTNVALSVRYVRCK